jgi:Luciferase-like monooxygenase
MQFGIFTVGDVTEDPTTGRTPTEADRIHATVTIAKKAEEVGLDIFATGEHHNPPFVPSSPTTLLGYIAAQTERIILSTSITLITTNDPVKIAEDFSVLQHLSGGRVDVMLGRGNTGPVYPWFGQDIRAAIPLTVEHYGLLHRLGREEVVDWSGNYRTPLHSFALVPRPLDGVPPFVWHGSIRTSVSAVWNCGPPRRRPKPIPTDSGVRADSSLTPSRAARSKPRPVSARRASCPSAGAHDVPPAHSVTVTRLSRAITASVVCHASALFPV